jgi:DNA-binding MarR family transcriptional regulator
VPARTTSSSGAAGAPDPSVASIAPVRAFRKRLRELEREVELALSDQTSCCGVTPAQCHLLLAVEEAGETSAAELAAELELDASTLSRSVDGLAKAGLLLRKEDPGNRRRQLLSLSAKGRAKAESINERCDRFYAELLGAMPAKDAKAIAEAMPLFVESLRAFRRGSVSEPCRATAKPASSAGRTAAGKAAAR